MEGERLLSDQWCSGAIYIWLEKTSASDFIKTG